MPEPSLRATGVAAALLASLSAAAQTADPRLESCVAIANASDRLACYDRAAGRAPAEPPPAFADSPGLLAARAAPPDEPARPAGNGLLSKYWELEPEDKRGVFNFIGYRANYVMPVHVTDRINRNPRSPTRDAVQQPNYREIEAKFQLSVRAKLAQDLLLPNADLWFGYTQQVLWQIWNAADSKPFRNSDYEPELIYVVPTPRALRALPAGWSWRYTELGLAHQSNGQSDPLSRSWNRSYLGAGFERGPWTLHARIANRLDDPAPTTTTPTSSPTAAAPTSRSAGRRACTPRRCCTARRCARAATARSSSTGPTRCSPTSRTGCAGTSSCSAATARR